MSTKKNLLFNTLNQVLAVIFPVITVPYVSRILGVDSIGVVGFSTTYASYFALIAALGVPLYGIKEIAKHKDSIENRSKIFSELFTINLISSLACSLIYLITIFAIPKLYAQLDFMLIAGFAVYLSAFSFDWYFVGRENFKMIALRSMIIKALSVALLFVLVKEPDDAIYYCALVTSTIIINQIWNFFYLIRKEFTIKFRNLNLRPHFKPLITILVTNIAISIYTILDTVMLGFMSTYTEVGYYSSAIRITRLLLPFTILTTNVILPKISYAHSINDTESLKNNWAKSFALISLFAAPISFGLFVISPSFVPVFFGEQFIGVVIPLQVLSVILLLVGCSNFWGVQMLVAVGLESKLLLCILVGTIINFNCNLFFIPMWGAKGAAIASVLAEFVILCATFFASRKFIKVDIDYYPIVKSIVSCLPMLVLYFILPEMSHYLKIAILVTFAVLSYFSIQFFLFKNKMLIELITKHFKINIS